MAQSGIHLVDATTNHDIPAAPEGAVLSGSGGDWRGIVAEHQQLKPMEMPPHLVVGHRLIIQLGSPLRFEWKNNARWNQRVYPTGSFALQSDGDFHAPRWHQPFECIAIALQPEFVSELVGGNRVEFEEVRGKNDSVITELALRFKGLLSTRTTGDSLFVENLTAAFSFHLLQNYSSDKTRLAALRGRLEGRLLKNVLEFAHDNLDQPLTLEQLAAQAHLSPFHFARQFKTTTGYSPHQFLLRIRIEKAQRLMAANRSLTETAFATGFYDQSHFVHAFKRVTGYTPRAFMRQR